MQEEKMKKTNDNIEQVKPTTKRQTSLWGIRLTAFTVVLVNVIIYIALQGNYGSGNTIFKFSVIGSAYLMIIGIFLFPLLMKSPADGMLVFVALSLVGCVARLAVHADILEIYSAITALIIGPIGFMVFLIVLINKR